MVSRRDVDILHALFQELAELRYGSRSNWAKVSNYQKVDSFFTSAAAVAAFANILNQVNPMAHDHVLIPPGNIRNSKTVGNIYGGLLKAYTDAGWEIAP